MFHFTLTSKVSINKRPTCFTFFVWESDERPEIKLFEAVWVCSDSESVYNISMLKENLKFGSNFTDLFLPMKIYFQHGLKKETT